MVKFFKVYLRILCSYYKEWAPSVFVLEGFAVLKKPGSTSHNVWS
jgi:hypothetical protein